MMGGRSSIPSSTMSHSDIETNNATASDDEEVPSQAYQERLQLKQMVDRLVDAGYGSL
jgi:hypothetical protein